MSTEMKNQNTLVPYWTLETATPTITGSPKLTPAEEVAFTPDNRTAVAEADYSAKGKYYCKLISLEICKYFAVQHSNNLAVVKLFIQYDGQATGSDEYAMGTGWMISSDTLVTAGHCAYNWDGYGRAKTIKVYAGYYGKSWTEYSAGKTVATTAGWLAGSKNKTKDVAFVQLQNSFKKVTKPFTYEPTPLEGNENLFIVGYPADKTVTVDGHQIRGGQMWESKGAIKWNLAETEYMLSYMLSTSGGNSGSPVLRGNLTSSIATHVLGSNKVNSGTTIGTYGNWYPPHIEVVRDPTKFGVIKTRSADGIKYVAVPTATKPESVLKAITTVKDIGAEILPAVLKFGIPFLGPVGGPLAALAGTLLGWAGSLSESGFDPENESSALPSKRNYAERAVLAEAALQTALKLKLNQLSDLELMDAIEDEYRGLQKNFGRVPPKLLGILLEPSTRIALDSILVKERIAAAKNESAKTNERKSIDSGDDEESQISVDSQTETFLGNLITPTFECPGEESFIDDLGNLISKGLKIALPIIKSAAVGLAALNNITSTEAAIVESKQDQHLSLLAKRAILGEAVLQALIKVDSTKLKKIEIPNDDGKNEAFFDSFKHVVQRIGRQVLDSAPDLIDLATPIIKGLLRGHPAKSTTSSSGEGAPSTGTEAVTTENSKADKGKANFASASFHLADEALADAVENQIVGLQGLEPGSDHPHLTLPLKDIIDDVRNGNLDGTRWISM